MYSLWCKIYVNQDTHTVYTVWLAYFYESMIYQIQIITHYGSTFHDASNNVNLCNGSFIHGQSYKKSTAKNFKTFFLHILDRKEY